MAKIDDSIYDLGDLPSSADDGIDFDPFAKPIKKEIQEPQNGKYRGEILRCNGDVYVWDGYNWNKIKSSQSSNILSSTSTTKRMPSPPVFSPVLNPIKKDSETPSIKDIFNSEPFKKESHREERIANRKGSWWRDLFSK